MLSGLYGLLRPLDLMQPYRLEMGTKLANARGKDLYAFWGDRISTWLNQALAEQGDDILLNLASNEYFSSVKRKALDARIIDTEFKDLKNGQYKIISFYAKKARGLMARYVIKERLTDPQGLKDFDYQGYRYSAEASSPDKLVFLRDTRRTDFPPVSHHNLPLVGRLRCESSNRRSFLLPPFLRAGPVPSPLIAAGTNVPPASQLARELPRRCVNSAQALARAIANYRCACIH